MLGVDQSDGAPAPLSDAELTHLALAADPGAEVAGDAVPLGDVLGHDAPGLLPDWYMPMSGVGAPSFPAWRRWSAGLLVVSFLVITAYGLCSTYGRLALL